MHSVREIRLAACEIFASRMWIYFISLSASAENFTIYKVNYFKSKLRDLSTNFAVKIIKLCETINGHYSLVNQLERSATSIGANIREVSYAHAKNDFISKLQIFLKECFETEYWLELFVKSEILDKDLAKELYSQCGTIRKLLISSINTAKTSQT